LEKRIETAKVASLNCTLYKLAYKHFKRIFKRDLSIKKRFQENCSVKQQRRSSLVNTALKVSKKFRIPESINRELNYQKVENKLSMRISQRFLVKEKNINQLKKNVKEMSLKIFKRKLTTKVSVKVTNKISNAKHTRNNMR
jgi:hypothetical protein